MNKEVVTLEKKADITMAIVNPATNLFLNLGLVFVVIVGAYRVNYGRAVIGITETNTSVKTGSNVNVTRIPPTTKIGARTPRR